MPANQPDEASLALLLSLFQEFTIEIKNQSGDQREQLKDIIITQSRAEEDLARIANDVAQIRQIVIGADGGNGLRSIVQQQQRDIVEIKKQIEEIKAQEKERNKFVLDWGWKIVAFVIGLLWSVPSLIKAIRDLVKSQ